MDEFDDFSPLPPRREKHGSKRNIENDMITEPESEIEPQSFQQLQKGLNSRLARRQALKEFTLNPQGYRQKPVKKKRQTKTKDKKEKKKARGKSGLIAANIILGLFLLLMASIFCFIIYQY